MHEYRRADQRPTRTRATTLPLRSSGQFGPVVGFEQASKTFDGAQRRGEAVCDRPGEEMQVFVYLHQVARARLDAPLQLGILEHQHFLWFAPAVHPIDNPIRRSGRPS